MTTKLLETRFSDSTLKHRKLWMETFRQTEAELRVLIWILEVWVLHSTHRKTFGGKSQTDVPEGSKPRLRVSAPSVGP